MSLAKYNARDVAKDFGMQAKAITGILAEHIKETVSPTKVLTDRELSIIFEHLTQRNQVESIESIYADVYHEPKKAEAPKAEPLAETPAKKRRNRGKRSSATLEEAQAALEQACQAYLQELNLL